MEINFVPDSHGGNRHSVRMSVQIAGAQNRVLCEIDHFFCLIQGQFTGLAAERTMSGAFFLIRSRFSRGSDGAERGKTAGNKDFSSSLLL